MNHCCTYFDRGFLLQGLALWRSLAAHDAAAVLWVLALDEFTAETLRETGEARLRVVTLAEVEAGDAELAVAKANCSPVEYMFTLSPVWPRWLLARHAEIGRLTCLDADLFFFGSPEGIFAAMDAAGASVAITAHRFPPALRALEKWGRYNVGVQVFRNDGPGRAVLDDWRARCLEWCRDEIEGERFADQKYLDAWPARFGATVLVLPQPGVNLAPWNWLNHRCDVSGGEVRVEGEPLVVFHFAKFRAVSERVWDSGQEEFGVMPRGLRRALYMTYWRAMEAERARLAAMGRAADYRRMQRRPLRAGWKRALLRVIFGTRWVRVGGEWIALGGGPLGRFSGRVLAWTRRNAARRAEGARP
jgi:hypothetical protein